MCSLGSDMAVFTCRWNIFIMYAVMTQWNGHLLDNPVTKDKKEETHCLGERTINFGSGYEFLYKLHQRQDLHQSNKRRVSRKKSESSRFKLRYKRRSLCGYTCNTSGLPTCYCDAACRDFNDCCSSSNGQETDDTNISETIHVENIFCEGPQREQEGYVHRFPFGVWMKQNCSKEVDKSLSSKCLAGNVTDDPLVIVPVTDRNGISYPNIFCAVCNGAEDASPWDLRAMYKRLIDMQNMKSLSDILQFLYQRTVIYPLPNKFAKPRACVRAEQNPRQNNLSPTGDPCYRYQQPVYLNGTLLRNSHCIGNLSNGCSAQNDPCSPKCLKPINKTYREYATPEYMIPAVIIELGPQFKLEHDNTKCKPHDLISDSEVNCIHFGCPRSPDVSLSNDVCYKYHTKYEHLLFEFKWLLKDDMSAEHEGLGRYVAMIYYVLLINGMSSDRKYFVYYSMDLDVCQSTFVGLRLQSRKIISWNEFLKTQNWLKSFQFSYTESTASKEISFSRLYDQHSSFDCPKKYYLFPNKKFVYLTNDVMEIYQSVAKYRHSFLLMEKCKMVYLNMSLQERTNKNGLTENTYKPLQFYCSNGFLPLRNQLWFLGARMIISRLF